jgi:hypothetical protein
MMVHVPGRTSTWVTSVVFVVSLVAYVLAQPPQAAITGTAPNLAATTTSTPSRPSGRRLTTRTSSSNPTPTPAPTTTTPSTRVTTQSPASEYQTATDPGETSGTPSDSAATSN